MRPTNNQYITVFDTTFGKPVSIPLRPVGVPERGYRMMLAACLALAVIGATTAAGAFGWSAKQKTPADQTAYSATFIKLPTGPSVEDALY